MSQVARQENFDVLLSNVTDEECVLGLAGPLSRRLLALIVDQSDDLSTDGFPFLATREITISQCAVRAVRVSYSG